MNDVVQALQAASAYEHPVQDIRLIETHLSWIFLAGDFAYKLKKPLQLAFVDFSTLERRAHYCREEVRLNQRYTVDLYIGALPVVRKPDGSIAISETPVADGATVLDWVVKMHQFDQSNQGDELVSANAVTTDQFYEFGIALAQQHADAETATDSPTLADAIQENFITLQSLSCIAEQHNQLEKMRSVSDKQLASWEGLLTERALNGYIRECHGDLHLANIMLYQNRLQAFDCLEFNRDFRTIDVWNDVAFLVMDCCIRGRADLAYSLVDGYLNICGDYEGAVLLSFYGQYRSMVRAKVAAIAFDQSRSTDAAAYDRIQRHLNWVEQRSRREPGRLIVCCGLSGSGKSYWSAQLVPKLAAIRLRSDVFRKISAGLAVNENSASGIGSGLYDAQRSEGLYAELTQLCGYLLLEGENVIIDATCLTKLQRAPFLQAAQQVGSKSVVLHLTAPDTVLRERIMQRKQEASDVSEADLAVLAWQQQHQEIPAAPEPRLVADSSTVSLNELVRRIDAFFDS